MSDPSERYKDEPHPASGHRTPSEIAEDEAGAIGGGPPNHPDKNFRAEIGPVRPPDKPPEPPATEGQEKIL